MDYYEIAWAAGFFDGEGTTYIRKDIATLIISIAQQEPTTLRRFQKAVDTGKLYGPYNKNGKDVWQVEISTRGAIIALGKLWPYLSEPKKHQATLALNLLTERLNGRPVSMNGRNQTML